MEKTYSQLRTEFNPNQFYWNFPSDHLPVLGMVINTTPANGQWTRYFKTFKIVTWNVLNENYFKYILSDSQGLKVSQITEATDRHGFILNILEDFEEAYAPAVFALQEVSPALLKRLELWAQQSGYEISIASNPNQKSAGIAPVDFGVIIYDPNELSLIDGSEKILSFENNEKYIHEVTFRTEGGFDFIFANIHRAFKDETVFPGYLSNNKSGAPWIVVGDLNMDRNEVNSLLADQPQFHLMKKGNDDFSLVNTRRELVDYDHILYSGSLRVEMNIRYSHPALKRFGLSKN